MPIRNRHLQRGRTPRGSRRERATWLQILQRSGLVFVCILIGLALSYLQFAKQAAEYESSAVIAMRMPEAPQNSADSKSGPATAWYDDLLRSRLMLDEAVSKNGLASLACLKEGANPVAALQSRLAVRPLDPAALTVELRFVATRPDDSERVLNALLATYGAILGDASGSTSAEALALLKQAKDELLEQVRRKERALADFRATMPAEWPGRRVLAERRTRLDQDELGRDELSRTILQLRSRLDAAVLAKDEGDQAALQQLMRPAVPTAPAVASAEPPSNRPRVGLIDLLAEEAELLKTYGERHPKVRAVRARIEALQPDAGGETPLSKLQAEERLLLESYGRDHPKVRAVREKIAELTALQAAPPDASPTPAQETTITPPRPQVEPSSADSVVEAGAKYIAALRSELKTREVAEKLAATSINEQREDIRRWSDWELSEDNLMQDIDRTRRLFESVLKRFQDSAKSQDTEQAAFLVLSVPKRGEPVRRSPLTNLLLGGGCGAGIGLVLTWLQIRARRDDSGRVGDSTPDAVPVLMHLPAPDPLTPPIDGQIHPALVVYHQPQFPAAEAYRSLRTIVNFRGGQVGAGHFGLLDSTAGDASLVIAANLAASFALSGRKTLLIDCGTGPINAYQLFGIKRPENLDDALHDRKELADALISTNIPELNVAQWQPVEPETTLEQTRLAMQAVREKYDVTVVRLSAVADERLAAASELVDCLVLVGAPSNDSESFVKIAELLQANSGRPILGAIVSGTRGPS